MRVPLRWLVVLTLLAAGQLAGPLAPSRAFDIDRDKVAIQNDVRQIAIFYRTYMTETGKPPRNLAQFLAYIKRDAPALHRALENGTYVLVITRNPSSQKVLVYQKKANSKKLHIVAMGDGSVDAMTTQELQKNLK